MASSRWTRYELSNTAFPIDAGDVGSIPAAGSNGQELGDYQILIDSDLTSVDWAGDNSNLGEQPSMFLSFEAADPFIGTVGVKADMTIFEQN